MNRRALLRACLLPGLAATALPARARPDAITPAQALGPFYPVDPIPVRADLLNRDGQRAQGTPLRFWGVVSRGGAPLAGARVEIWQCDARGVYRHPGSDLAAFDPGFEGYGAQITDAQGRYAFETIVPVPYEPRPPHIHVRVWFGGETLLVTQAYPEGQVPAGGIGGWFGAKASDGGGLAMRIVRPSRGPAEARFDLVMR